MPKEETEEYLEAMLDLSAGGRAVKTTALAERLGVAPASATEAVQRLCRDGLVSYEPYKGASLTPKGREAASRVKRKHRLLEVFLTRVLRMAPRKAHVEACRMEHSLSDDTEEALCRSLHGPDCCPDGDPIPPCDRDVESCATCIASPRPSGKRDRGQAVPLTSMQPGRTARVLFVRGGRAVVKRLCDLGLTPGTQVRLLRSAPMRGPVEVRVRGCDLAIGRGIALKVFVEDPGSAA
ncbi:MAG: metal-dependent transcriptional regulator [Euryarchaeota archaeon]|nr:metal-dependent transcriptional regulator [Euryarchaeota archaeon]